MKKVTILLMLSGALLLIIGLGSLYKGKYFEIVNLVKAKNIVNSDIDSNLFISNMSEGEVIGVIELPELKKELPILEGTNDYELSKGVGHYTKTYMPNQGKQILLSGHRDTVFSRLGELNIGDNIILRFPYGTFEYVVDKTKITDALDPTIIDLNLENEELVLSTCYPFNYIGSAPDRYIVYAYPK